MPPYPFSNNKFIRFHTVKRNRNGPSLAAVSQLQELLFQFKVGQHIKGQFSKQICDLIISACSQHVCVCVCFYEEVCGVSGRRQPSLRTLEYPSKISGEKHTIPVPKCHF